MHFLHTVVTQASANFQLYRFLTLCSYKLLYGGYSMSSVSAIENTSQHQPHHFHPMHFL